jgi:hypothetical protein
MGEVIQMFRSPPEDPDTRVTEQTLHDALSKELSDSIADVQAAFDTLWASHTYAEFAEELASIKKKVSTWPTKSSG